MADWVTISGLATAGGTLALAGATYASVRASKRAAEVAEVSLRQQLRPVLVQSGLDDPVQKIGFVDGHWVRVRGGEAVVEREGDSIYLVLSLRNVGSGIGVLQAWHVLPEWQPGNQEHTAVEEHTRLGRDLYIPAGGIGLWQGAIRDPSDERHGPLAEAILARQPMMIDLLYTDHMGQQPTISRFSAIPGDDRWICSVVRHWPLDRPGPR